jgi:filamentous hemagglutinin family protein
LAVEANPSHPTVAQGSAVVSSQGSQLTVATSGNAVINWGSFNIGTGETTTFVEPSATSVVWNKIADPHPSQILGHLDANGYVVLQNQSGFYVGGHAVINAAGLIMTTAPAAPLDLSGGGAWQFNAPPPRAAIINYGQINAGAGAPVFLIAHDVENHGSITAPAGNIGLYAGKQVMVSSRPDGRGLSAQVSLPEGSVDNSGSLIADAGTIALRAQVVNQGGLIQANSVREQNGVIELVAGEALTLGASSVIQARGDAQGPSPGGNVTLQSGNTFGDQTGSVINVAGGEQGGAGGVVEISAPVLPAIHSAIDGHASAGGAGGGLLIDPSSIMIDNSGAGSAGSGTVASGSAPSTLDLNVTTAFTGFSHIDLQATGTITLAADWDLGSSTGISAPGSQLTLEAGNSILIGSKNNTVNLTADAGWSVTLEAGRNFSVANTVVAGQPNTAAAGTVKFSPTAANNSITLAGASTVQAQDGSISLLAGNSITVSSGAATGSGGAVVTLGGGGIDAEAMSGNIDTGSKSTLSPTGYVFNNSSKNGATAYAVSPSLGGISTAAGGDVNLFAGGNVTSFLPVTTSSKPTDAGSGAFGPEPGVVTVTAGGSVYGHFVAADSERNGVLVASTITALAGDAGDPGKLLALSLVKGGWEVNAPNGSIDLQEVRNPNGVFNGSASGTAPFRHLFGYDPNSFVDLAAGNAVVLAGTVLPRYTGDAVPVIYPPSLTIAAGAGGVTLGNNVTLFPSPDGELNITTTAGGTLEGSGFELAMSDSGATSWTSAGNFASDHAATPVQKNNPQPVVLNISGNVDNISISTPKETQITVHGEMDNTSFTGQNLHAGDVTFIDVTGRIFNQNIYSFVSVGATGLTVPPPRFSGDKPDYLSLLENAVVPGSNPSSAGAGALFPNLSLFYLPATQQLGYSGQMDSTTEQLLTGTLQEKTYYANGQPILDAKGNYVTTPATFGVPAATIQALYAASQNAANASTAPLGFQIGGPGQFNVTAQSLDLGVSGGIVSEGPFANPALAKVAGAGAAININVQGDLALFASKIASYYGGAINIDAGGTINAGLQDLPFTDSTAPLGIWTSGHSDVHIVAQGNIDVDGSRIAAFAGGNIFVESLDGSVDAGSGNAADVFVNYIVVNPVSSAVTTPQQPIAGSGILATTLPNAPASQAVGNITVLTPRGDINASQGGIAQEPLNGNTSLRPTVTLTAGTRDQNGKIVNPGNINASDSGVIGINTILNAAGNISGLVIAQGNSSINAAANVSGTFLAGGTSTFNAAGTITGIAIGGLGISVGSGKFEGVALSQNVSGGGAQSALASSSTASATSQASGAQQAGAQKAETSDALASSDDDDKKRKARGPLLVKYTGRVTVLLPKVQ